MTRTKSTGIGETARTLVYALLIAFGIRTFVVEPFNIPSGSLIPTLLVGDYLFVTKFSYGYSAKTIAFGAPLFKGRILASTPKRGDIIVFRNQVDGVVYIKRLIGLPGDKVQMLQGRLWINGKQVERREIEPYVTKTNWGRSVSEIQYEEILPSSLGSASVTHRIIERNGDAGQWDTTGEYSVPDGNYFFMGDNRDNSQDSRTPQVGLVPEENLIGRAEIVWFSLDEDTHFWELWKWPTSIRWSRLFMLIR
ncbi:signal peptidase I [Roseiterribacter gracilis]|uniref:Signal peptidase I n=1 Tax=Roseiterribacter gracilis TaxID=2812848 RepID=A0A8S8XAL3_9PROT|nr:signal peptidase I [Rhodospirillales bacterium TMPK1]